SCRWISCWWKILLAPTTFPENATLLQCFSVPANSCSSLPVRLSQTRNLPSKVVDVNVSPLASKASSAGQLALPALGGNSLPVVVSQRRITSPDFSGRAKKRPSGDNLLK